jgi:hypothetical protein
MGEVSIMVIVRKYNEKYKKDWDQFIEVSKNATFLFFRDYMDYHLDRFQDYSLFVYDEKEKILAVLPANRQDNTVYSHSGLTFGGFLVDKEMTTEKMLEVFSAVSAFFKSNNITTFIYKCIPYIYHKYPTEEDKYALFINNAKLIRRDVSTTIKLANRYSYQERRKRAIKKSIKEKVVVMPSEEYDEFWKVLIEVLAIYHKTMPVHSVSEIKLLAERFKNNIKLFVAKQAGKIIAGTVIFENEHIVHAQYLVSSERGRLIGALDVVLDYLITERYKDKVYFDFGISNEQQGRFLNTGLIAQKEGFGARAVVHDFYEINIV